MTIEHRLNLSRVADENKNTIWTPRTWRGRVYCDNTTSITDHVILFDLHT